MEKKDIDRIVEALRHEQVKVQDFADGSACLTFSQLVREVKSDINSLREDIAEVKKNVQPAVDAISASKILGKGSVWLAGILLSFTAIWVFFKEVVKAAK